jgi:UDP-N-acetyl-2-amino-2-deoxyglucuronate dehydrogenase
LADNNKKVLGVGVIGLGRIAPRHIEDSIEQIPELKLVAVCDIDKKLAERVGKEKKVKYYTDYRHLIKDPNVNIVSVCTPNGLHQKMGLYAAKYNKHVVMEKPLALNYLQAKKMVEAFKKTKAWLFPVLQVRYNPAVQALKETLDKGYFGEIYSASLIVRWTRPQAYFDESPWKGSLKMDGGSLMTQAIHYIDITQYLLGPAQSVFGKLDQKAHNTETEDMANAIIDLKTKVRVNLEFTINTYPHNLECSLAVLGEKGTVKIGGMAMNKIELWYVENVPPPNITGGNDPNVYAGGMYVGSCPNHKSIYENLVNVLIYKKPSFLQGKDALESLRIIDAIRQSSKLNKEIKL